MKCNVYKCANKTGAYLYLKNGVNTDALPASLQALLGDLSLVLPLDLSKTKKLAQVQISEVMSTIKQQDYFLQLPPAETLAKQTPEKGFAE